MPRGLVARSRLLSFVACAILFMVSAGAGCSTTTSAVTVTGKTLTIYYSWPANLSTNPGTLDVIHGEQLAFNQLTGQVHGNFRRLSADLISANARTAIEDTTSAVAYVGEPGAGTSVESLGITNAQDLLQVSPAPGASQPTKNFQSYSTYGRTFASMSPTAGQAAQTILGEPAGRTFARQFRTKYGTAPSSGAVLGYAATTAVLEALRKAGSAASNRSTVVSDFFALKNASLTAGPSGPTLGTYTVNKNGTVTLSPASG
jgi:hypothetical protein